MSKLNFVLKHLISLGFAIVFMALAVLFMFAFSGIFSQSSEVYRVGVVDTGLDLNDPRLSAHLCPSGHKDFTGEGMQDSVGHGTHIVGLIEKYAENSEYCLVILKYYSPNMSAMATQLASNAALKAATQMHLNLVNYSGDGYNYSQWEKDLFSTNFGVIFVVAAGNDGRSLLDYPYYPAAYDLKNLLVVGSLNQEGTSRAGFSNFGPMVKYWEIGDHVLSTYTSGRMTYLSGTSQATAIETGKFIMTHRGAQ